MRPKLRLWPTCRVTGIMAQVGRGMTRYVSKKMSKDSPSFLGRSSRDSPAIRLSSPGSLEEALALLGRLDDANAMSGGQSLLPTLKQRLASLANIVDTSRIPGLDALTEADGYRRIGALVIETELEQSAVVPERHPILLDTVKVSADPLVRTRASICGNVAHGDPANDHPATMIALRARMVASGPDGERVIVVVAFPSGCS